MAPKADYPRSEDDEEEEDGAVEGDESKTAGDITTQTAETGEEGDRSVQVEKQAKKRSKNDSMELPEYSTDELRTVDKEMLNAEITQLEGMSATRNREVFC
jgi:structural maintenance of chromosome 4